MYRRNNMSGKFNRAPAVYAGELYRHYKGGIYSILSVASDHEDRYNMELKKVIYISMDDGHVYHRDYVDFIQLVDVGEFVQSTRRFNPIGETQINIEGGKINVTRKF